MGGRRVWEVKGARHSGGRSGGLFFSFLMELLKIASTNQIRSIKFLYLLLQTTEEIQT